MTHFKVLFLDMDGTIIKPDGTIEETTKTAIKTVQDKGLEVFLATGRPIHEIRETAEELNINSFIGYNGAFGIYKGEHLFQEPMNADTVLNFLTIANDYHHEVVCYTHKVNAFTTLDTPLVNDFMKMFHLHKNELYSPTILNEVLGMTLINVKENEHLHYLKEDGVHLSQVNVEGMTHCFDVIRDKVNKGVGVHLVLDHLGISKESAIAFGDGLNDKEMLMNVGEGFAMGNAHPEIFSYAKNRTTEVTNSGVFNGLKTLGLID